VFCPVCGRALVGPASPTVPFPIFVCPHDGVIHDQRRELWHGLPDAIPKLHCPICGAAMEFEPKDPPHRIFFCYQCGTTYDRERSAWFGLAYYRDR
jgi:predicted nucleic acid-binding Zn ribbon protein